MKVAVCGVLTIVGAAAALAGVAMHLGAREPGTAKGWATAGLVLTIVGAVAFVAAGVATATLIVTWRRHREERSNRP